jgi:polyisoprenoid-binding protein YceI
VEYDSLLPKQSTLNFTYAQMGVPVTGGFKVFGGHIHFDPQAPQSASLRIELELSSIDAGAPDATSEALGKDWMDVKTFPHASFTAKSFSALGGSRYEARGDINIKGHVKEAIVPFTFKPQAGGLAVLEGQFVLKRADFALGTGSWSDFGVVANDIQIKFAFPIKFSGQDRVLSQRSAPTPPTH